IADDTEQAFAETKRFLDEYYSADFSREAVDRWATYGPPERCAERIGEFARAGVQNFCLRFSSYDQMAQLRRFLDRVLPLL
ncbi:MAG: hypothetical protein O7A67_10195, partial [SAR324 cluster bacterium]|nr:hypothetical protein [SAR324 cluster bacterium]